MIKLITIITIISVIFNSFYIPFIFLDKYETQNVTLLSKDNNEYRGITSEMVIKNTNNLFIENLGQLDNDQVLFYNNNGMIWCTRYGIWLRHEELPNNNKKDVDFENFEIVHNPINKTMGVKSFVFKSIILNQEFKNSNEPIPIGSERLGWYNNFFYGNKSSKWINNVPNYQEIFFKNLYEDIDLRYYFDNNHLNYNLILHPGSDLSQVIITYNSAEGLEIDKFGNLIINTEIGGCIEPKPYIYQQDGPTLTPIIGDYKILNDINYSFELSNYNPTKALIIKSSIKLNFSTYIGGTDRDDKFGFSDAGYDIITDEFGNSYITGYTLSKDFPTSSGVQDRTFNGGLDLFILKLNNDGSSIIFSTFIGGDDADIGYKIVIDSFYNIYVTGETRSANFPTTNNAFDRTFNYNLSYPYFRMDAFVLKLNQNASKLIYSTFIGGGYHDAGYGLVLDKDKNAYITGFTFSEDFPVTQKSLDTTHNSFVSLNTYEDIFVSKLSSNGSFLYYSTFVGGMGSELGFGIDIDSQNNVYVTGRTNSTNFPITSNAYDKSFNGKYDIFVFKLNDNGSILIYSTFIGGSDQDWSFSIKVDNNYCAYLTGTVFQNSTGFPITQNAFNKTVNGTQDAFALKLNSEGTNLIYSTFLGGEDVDCGRALAIDPGGNAYVTGWTHSKQFPITSDAFDKSYNGSDTIGIDKGDIFFSKIDKNGSSLLYSTYVGGNKRDYGYGIAIDQIGNIYLTGYTNSSDFPITQNSYNRTFSGNFDVFVTKFAIPSKFKIKSIEVLLNSTNTDMIYSKLGPYTFRIKITDNFSLHDLEFVKLNLEVGSSNIILIWNETLNKFDKLFDSHDYISLSSFSNVYNTSLDNWSIDFKIIFNWTFPNEQYHSAQVYVRSKGSIDKWFHKSHLYRVENDIIFNKILKIEGEDNRTVSNFNLVRGNEQLQWIGLIPVYENTTDIYPPADEFDITIWDEDYNYWLDSPEPGQPINITMITPNKTTSSFNYTINLTGIPPECDKTNRKFTIRIDTDNATFSNPWPGEKVWQKNSEVYTGITITDYGGGFVDNTSIMHSISEDNGTTWSGWNLTEFTGESVSITVHDFVAFEDGDDNFIKWCAMDSVGNGPAESETYRILVDTQPMFFSNTIPLSTQVSSTGEVEVGITIIDNTSGVNASAIKYSISIDSGTTWSSWKAVTGFQNGNNIGVKFNLKFPNGTGNRIRWRGYDVAGNGPTYSDEYIINVNIPMIPVIKLVSPVNNSNISTTSVIFSWEVINNYHPNIVFDIKLGTTNPSNEIQKQNYPKTSFAIDNLENVQTYYWTVIPKLNNTNGTCISGIWSFTVEIPLPKVILKTPENNSMITSTLPTLVWSLGYEGTESVSYNIYFGTNKDPPLEHEKLSTNYYAIDTALLDNTTYYWKIVPWVGKYEGFSSEIWSFTVKLKQDDKIPEFGIELDLSPNPLAIKTGEVKFISAIVINLGKMNDNFTVTIGNINNSKLTAENYRQDTLEIEPGKNKEFLIMISVEENTKPGFENITITAKSKLAEKYNLEIQDSQVLTIKILEKDEQKERGQPISIFYFSILLLITILIIISIIILIIVRKKSSKKDSELVETQDIIHETPPESITIPEPTQEPEPVLTQQQDETLEE